MTTDNLAALLMAFLALPALGQPATEAVPAQRSPAVLEKGLFELSTAASLSRFSRSDSDYGGGDYDFTILNVPLRLGLMLNRDLEVEAEGVVTHLSYSGESNSSTGYQLGVNLLYHFGDRRVVPFVLGGAGLGDAIDVYGFAFDTNDSTIKLLRAGAGLKAFVGSRAAFRAEYRFTRYMSGHDPGSYSELYLRGNQHKLFTGISLFLR